MPFSIDAVWSVTQPSGDQGCAVSLTTSLSNAGRGGGGGGGGALASNGVSNGLPMVVAVVGIPSSLEVDDAR